jgi:hypothetical protein
MEEKREAHSKVVQMVLPRANEKAAIVGATFDYHVHAGLIYGLVWA